MTAVVTKPSPDTHDDLSGSKMPANKSPALENRVRPHETGTINADKAMVAATLNQLICGTEIPLLTIATTKLRGLDLAPNLAESERKKIIVPYSWRRYTMTVVTRP